MTRTVSKMGWRRDLPDHRDYLMDERARWPAGPFPVSVDLRSHCPPVVDQGQLGSCTANAIAGAIQFEEIRQGLPSVAPSRLMIYYDERAMEGTISVDAGAEIRDGIKSVFSTGVCPEVEWPYDISRFTERPPDGCYTAAKQYKSTEYARVPQVRQWLKSCLVGGLPFVFGFSVYESFESAQVAQTGVAPMPRITEALLGGHAILCVGYDDQTQTYLCRNSWGTGWGMAGYFTLPYAYLEDEGLAADFWRIALVEEPKVEGHGEP